MLYKHLPNSCFHCGKQGHLIKNCPIKNPHLILPQAPQKPRTAAQDTDADNNSTPSTSEPVKEPEFTTVQRRQHNNKNNKNPQTSFKPDRYSILASVPDPKETKEALEIVASTPIDQQRIGKEVDTLDAIEITNPTLINNIKIGKSHVENHSDMDISKELKRNRALLGSSTPKSSTKGGPNKPPNKR